MTTDDLTTDHAAARDQYIAAWNGSDVEAVARYFTDNAQAQVGDSLYNGLPEIRRGWIEPSVAVVNDLQTQEVRVTPRDNGLREEGRYSVRIAPPDTTAFQQTGRYTADWVRGPDGSMRIRSTTVAADDGQQQ